MTPATDYGLVDLRAAEATYQRNQAPQGFLYVEGIGLLPRVSHILDTLGKPGLERWKLNRLRELFFSAAAAVPDDSANFLARFQKEVRRMEAAEKREVSAATLGSAFHRYVEWRSNLMLGVEAGEAPTNPIEIEPAIDAWEGWAAHVGYRPLLVEHRCWCTDAECGFTGGIDAVAEVEGRVLLCDWKRAKSIYNTYVLQVASYEHLLHRSTGLIVDGLLIVKVPQDSPGPVETRHVERDEIPVHYAAFRSLLHVWKWGRGVVEREADARAAARRLTLNQGSPYSEIRL